MWGRGKERKVRDGDVVNGDGVMAQRAWCDDGDGSRRAPAVGDLLRREIDMAREVIVREMEREGTNGTVRFGWWTKIKRWTKKDRWTKKNRQDREHV